ncbi:MAG: PEP-CTERM sorting domain-containing protein [Nibricoccus sp.]
MKTSRTALILGFALAAFTSIAQAQLITKTFNVSGSTGVVTRFTIWINVNADTFVVNIDNTLAAGSNAKVGTVVGFGFNTPFGSITVDPNVTFSMNLTQGSNNPNPDPNNSDNYWTETSKYDPAMSSGNTYDQDYGVATTSSTKGVGYNEKATLTFKFNSNNITTANLAQFFDNAYSSSTTNRDFDITVNWADVSKKQDYLKGCVPSTCDIGGIDLTFSQDSELPPTPEPSTYGLMGAAALMGIAAHRRHKAKKAAKTV